jgi:8-oxo-dGTP pyrophosphatase MutT (NUDIX family)
MPEPVGDTAPGERDDEPGGRPSDQLSDELSDEFVDAPVLASEVTFTGRVWDIRRDTVDYGGSMVREYVDHTGAVVVLALDDEDRVLLIKQYRHPVRSRDWELPAGLLDIAGESPLVAAKRELAEEADYEAADWKVLVDFTSSPGGSNEVLRIYLARDLCPTGTVFAREEEEADIEPRWVPLDEAVRAVLGRRVRNVALQVAVLAAAASRADGFASLGDPDLPFERGASLQRSLHLHTGGGAAPDAER